MPDPFVDQLAALCRAHPTRAKWVFVPTHPVGRTLGDRLVLEGTDWLNLRFVTPLSIALRMGSPFLVERGIDPSEEGLGPALMMRLLLGLPAEDDGYFRHLADQPTMAQALWRTVRELRMTGVKSADLENVAFASAAKHAELRALLAAYEAFLSDEKRGDMATVYEEAMLHPDWCPIQAGDCWTALPDENWTPLQRRLLDSLPGERLPPRVLDLRGATLPRRLQAEKKAKNADRIAADPAMNPPGAGTEVSGEAIDGVSNLPTVAFTKAGGLESAAMLISRRAALTSVAGVMCAPAFAKAAAGRKKSTAFALIGDRYHNSDYVRVGLGRTIQKELGVSIDFCDETKMLDAETLKGYKLLIMLRDGMIWPDGYPDESTNAAWVATGRPPLTFDPPTPQTNVKAQFWMKPEQGRAVRAFVNNGGSALFLHNVTHVGLTDQDFRHVLGAAYAGHPPIRTFKVKVTNPNHPITKGVGDFIVTDEQHYMDYDKDPKQIFLETVNEDGLDYQKRGPTAPGGWSYDYGKGRICYLSPGHLLTVLWNPEYIKLQQNAVRWLLRVGQD